MISPWKTPENSSQPDWRAPQTRKEKESVGRKWCLSKNIEVFRISTVIPYFNLKLFLNSLTLFFTILRKTDPLLSNNILSINKSTIQPPLTLISLLLLIKQTKKATGLKDYPFINQLGRVAHGVQSIMNFIIKQTVPGQNLKFKIETYTPPFTSQHYPQTN